MNDAIFEGAFGALKERSKPDSGGATERMARDLLADPHLRSDQRRRIVALMISSAKHEATRARPKSSNPEPEAESQRFDLLFTTACDHFENESDRLARELWTQLATRADLNDKDRRILNKTFEYLDFLAVSEADPPTLAGAASSRRAAIAASASNAAPPVVGVRTPSERVERAAESAKRGSTGAAPLDRATERTPVFGERSFAYYRRLIFWRWRWFLWATVIALSLGLGLFVYLPQQFQAEVRMMYQPREAAEATSRLEGKMEELIGNLYGRPSNQRTVGNQKERIRSRQLLEAVLLDVGSVSEATPDATTGALVRALRRRLSISEVEGSDVLVISLTGEDAATTVRLANTIARKFIEQDVEERRKVLTAALNDISEQLAELQVKRRRFDRAEAHYDEYERLEREQAALEKQQLDLDERFRQAKSKIVEDLTLARRTLKDNHPRRVQLENALVHAATIETAATLDALPPNESANPLVTIRASQLRLAEQQRALETELVTARGLILAAMSEDHVDFQRPRVFREELADLRRRETKFRLDEDQLRHQQAQVLNNLAITAPAEEAASLTGSNFAQYLILLLLVANFMAAIIMIMADTYSSTISTLELLEEEDIAPVLGEIPNVRRFLNDPNCSFLETLSWQRHREASYYFFDATKIICHEILARTPPREPISLVISSANPQEGKTVCSAIIGAAFAHLGQRTLLVGGNLRRPSLDGMFVTALDGAESKGGLVDALQDAVTWRDAVIDTPLANLRYLPAGQAVENTTRLLRTADLSQVLSEMEREYDVVLFDSSPVLLLSDAVLLAREMKGLVLVFGLGLSKRRHLIRCLRRLVEQNITVLGMVANHPTARTESMVQAPYGYSKRFPAMQSDFTRPGAQKRAKTGEHGDAPAEHPASDSAAEAHEPSAAEAHGDGSVTARALLKRLFLKQES